MKIDVKGDWPKGLCGHCPDTHMKWRDEETQLWVWGFGPINRPLNINVHKCVWIYLGDLAKMQLLIQ